MEIFLSARLVPLAKILKFLELWECFRKYLNNPPSLRVNRLVHIKLYGVVLLIGGAILEEGDGTDFVQRYDPRTDTWTELTPMLIARSGSACCILNGFIYVIGGWHASTENTNRVERLDIANNRWERVASMNVRRYRPGKCKIVCAIDITRFWENSPILLWR